MILALAVFVVASAWFIDAAGFSPVQHLRRWYHVRRARRGMK